MSMTAEEVWTELNNRGVRVEVWGDQLVVRPRRVLDDELRRGIRANIDSIMARAQGHSSGGVPDAFETALDAVFKGIAREYVQGALPWVWEHRPELTARIGDVEAAIDSVFHRRDWSPVNCARLRDLLYRYRELQREAVAEYSSAVKRSEVEP